MALPWRRRTKAPVRSQPHCHATAPAKFPEKDSDLRSPRPKRGALPVTPSGKEGRPTNRTWHQQPSKAVGPPIRTSRWAPRGLNAQPPAFQTGALPIELSALRGPGTTRTSDRLGVNQQLQPTELPDQSGLCADRPRTEPALSVFSAERPRTGRPPHSHSGTTCVPGTVHSVLVVGARLELARFKCCGFTDRCRRRWANPPDLRLSERRMRDLHARGSDPCPLSGRVH